jgi:N-acetylglutamate synthase-like GNAT family acetyltransferase
MLVGLTFRRYRAEDQAGVWSVFAACTEQLGFSNGPWDDDMRTIPRTYLDAGEFIVGEMEGRIVAHAAFLHEPKGRASVRRVAVHPDVQQRGVGHMLMLELEARARGQGITSLHLDTSIGQTAAQRLYQKCGYQEVGHEVLSSVTCIMYEKIL